MPSLCLSWIDASLLAKDAMYKTMRANNKEMYYTDDGFAVGIAYCLAILKQVRAIYPYPFMLVSQILSCFLDTKK